MIETSVVFFFGMFLSSPMCSAIYGINYYMNMKILTFPSSFCQACPRHISYLFLLPILIFCVVCLCISPEITCVVAVIIPENEKDIAGSLAKSASSSLYWRSGLQNFRLVDKDKLVVLVNSCLSFFKANHL